MLSFELNGIMEVIFREGSMLTFLDAYDKKLIIVDNNEHIIYANQKARTALHQIHKTIQGKRLCTFFKLPQLKDVLSEGISYSTVPVEIDQQILNLNISPIEVNRDLVGAVITFQDDLFEMHDISTMKLCNSISRETGVGL